MYIKATLSPLSPTLLQHCATQLLSPSAMPSLRRTFSYPPVRSSPYPTYSPSSALYNASRAQGGHGHRRSSGSDVSHRRVLADIEWWRVADGQRLDHGDDFHQVDGDQDADQRGQASNEQPAMATPLSLDDWSSSWTSGNTLIITSLPEVCRGFFQPSLLMSI
jgi:hypothetical protein